MDGRQFGGRVTRCHFYFYEKCFAPTRSTTERGKERRGGRRERRRGRELEGGREKVPGRRNAKFAGESGMKEFEGKEGQGRAQEGGGVEGRRRTEEERNSKNLELLEATRGEGSRRKLKDWNESRRHMECIKL